MNAQPNPASEQEVSRAIPAAVSSLLVADCGAVFTKVSLLGLVEGQYRLMARGEVPTTIYAPQSDITEGVLQAISTIEFITGRRLVEGKQILTPEQPNGDGVDLFISTISAGEPLRLIVMGAVNPSLENLSTQAISGLYAQSESVPSPSFTATTTLVGVGAGTMQWSQERVAQEWEQQIGRIRDLQPHAAMIVGMADGPAGPTSLQEACQLLINALAKTPELQRQPPAVLYAGAPQYVEAVRRMLQGTAEVQRIDPLSSVVQLGPVSMAIGTLHEKKIINSIPGFSQLQAWSQSEPIASATSLSSLVRFLAQHYAMNVTAVDVGGSTTSVMLAGEQGEFIPMVNAGIGVSGSLGNVLKLAGFQRIARWLPFTITEDEVRQFVAQHKLHPHLMPTETRDLFLTQAFAREALSLTLEAAQKTATKWPDSDLILATGGILAHAPKYGHVAMMLLDALQPRGVTSLVLDKTMLISQLGAVATVAPITAVQVNENDAVSHRLGTCVIPFGNVQPGQLAVRVGIEYSNGRQVNVDVMGGSIEVIPLRSNEQALLTLFPAPGVDVGLGPGERARAAEEIDGGLIGLIIDARGRPLILPVDETERQARLMQWLQVLGV
ncbi:glutamate mutase L [Tengunoibacter tsumagoiensis]|uniref:Methylaspartate mutase n=1 Tax=Tengunoibacter tsumagoiensis TaxID=2014871 RepID=A0A402A5E1_9CHLR|nr:glutamate mutase L [Tengunoibacter tsumagoiensis]GCE14320.1 hypothetical protein KTT_41790 [Tengunoibacter tsumagoiensis]